jgi:hypothetical protein
MAVSKIRKISSWTLIACTIVTLVVVALFFFGGDNEPLDGKMWYPKFTELVLTWTYIILGITIVATLLFAFVQFANTFKTDAKKALVSLGVLVLFVLLFVVTYLAGNGTPIDRLATSEATIPYNVPGWLKLMDMLLYSIYTMFAITLVAIIAGSVTKIFNK